MELDQNQKDEIAAELHEEYNPTAVGNINQYPPYDHYKVNLYFKNFNRIENRYNRTVNGEKFNFLIENVHKSGDEHIATMRIEEVDE